MSPLKRIGDFSLMDLESVWLILEGSSVIDWRRMHFVDEDSPHAFLASQEFRSDSAADRARLEQIKAAAIDYMRRQFDFPVPRPVERADTIELLRVASGISGSGLIMPTKTASKWTCPSSA